MNGHALQVLEFDRLREIVSRHASSGPGSARILELLPTAGSEEAAARLAETEEYGQLLRAGEEPPLEGIRDINPALVRLSATGAMLSPAELLDIASTLAAGRRVRTFFSRLAGRDGRSAGTTAPLLAGRAAAITPEKDIEEAVSAALDESGEVKDSASPELRRVRKLIARVRDEVLDRLGRMLRAADAQSVVQEQVITVRDDRYVIPLKPGFRQSVKGVVHGRSGSRATLFVEPLEVLEQNNRLAELRADEREEVERVLRSLSAQVAARAEGIAETLSALAHIDAVAARARFGAAFRGTVPQLSRERGLRLRAARHPLLVAKGTPGGVVPNDVDLTGDRRALIISGPNAGGKTVVLKTIGLLCLMAQSGIPVTADEGSEVPVLSDLFADIGDEQSLEQDLSTFSSHMGRIAEILRGADRDSLVLLDELGSGTDPAEGAALGSAVLQSLLDRGCLTVATTHHGSLKLFGSRTEGAVNAAMEFDAETLQPTYRFIPGRPGRSYGIDMAARIGVPGEVVRDARSRLSGDEADLDRLLEQIEQDARKARVEREQIEADRREAEKLRAEAAAAARSAADEARATRQKARQDSREVLAALRQKLKDLSLRAAMDGAAVREERSAVDALARELEPRDERPEQPPASVPELHPGDRVRLPKFKRTGSVVAVHKDGIEIDSNGMRLRVPAREALAVERAALPEQRTAAGWSADLEAREGIPDRLNLLGLRVDEALAEVERFLDRAGMQGFQQVTVIHGLGTGALKAAVTGYLKGHPMVAAIRPGEPSEGGAGVTVAEMKK